MGRDLTALRADLAARLSAAARTLGAPAESIPGLEDPKDPSHGDLAFPAFRLAKALKKAPLEIAHTLAETADLPTRPPGWRIGRPQASWRCF